MHVVIACGLLAAFATMVSSQALIVIARRHLPTCHLLIDINGQGCALPP